MLLLSILKYANFTLLKQLRQKMSFNETILKTWMFQSPQWGPETFGTTDIENDNYVFK